jgi:hypothetical protein
LGSALCGLWSLDGLWVTKVIEGRWVKARSFWEQSGVNARDERRSRRKELYRDDGAPGRIAQKVGANMVILATWAMKRRGTGERRSDYS